MAKKKKDDSDKISEEAEALAASETSVAAAEEEAEKAAAEAAVAAEDRKKEEAKAKESGAEVSGIKAVFRRDTMAYETGPGDRTYSEDDEITFASFAEYNRWHRRGACETPEDREVRLKAELAKQARDLRVQQGG